MLVHRKQPESGGQLLSEQGGGRHRERATANPGPMSSKPCHAPHPVCPDKLEE